ncbi:MAG: [protein-PII] uridylyltransferase [Gammaproteobacteria bacterium]|nr:[protein-PII] uridylyltransferase [Gammaproteobacteria bacterium]
MNHKKQLEPALKDQLKSIADCRNEIKEQPQKALSLLKQAVTSGQTLLQKHFKEHHNAYQIVFGRSFFVDNIIQQVAEIKFSESLSNVSIIAAGGYGRGELHPHSDVDLMILLPNQHDNQYDAAIEQFLMLLWDIKLEIGHSVRTLGECTDEAKKDITVITNITESRLLTGCPSLYQEMLTATSTQFIWDSKTYFESKLQEQHARHIKFETSAFKLEPNVKESQGGLRDIQMIGWVAKRHFGANTLAELVDHGFLTPREFKTLDEGEELLWKIRTSLHYLTGRREDRLLFDYQRDLALEYDYQDGPNNLAIESFMQNYYRTVMKLERLNEMLLQLLREAILFLDQPSEPQIINTRFQIINGYISARNEEIFSKTPTALLEIFLLLEQNRDILGVRAQTIRLIREHLYLIDDKFRQSDDAKELFMNIIKAPEGLTHVLRRMNRYGLLATYIPAFEKIVGRMQYDLFHAFTVDQHTLTVVRNLRRFSAPEFLHEYPLCSAVFNHLPKPELIYLAGLFHDIAKGRGGDHSELGAVDAKEFCLHHNLDEADAELVSWLVRSHLIMSVTAQRKDLSDPDVINLFASQIGTQTQLDYLYLLTVADIRGTNPTTWNSWKDSLLSELYNKTSVVLRLGMQTSVSIDKSIRQCQQSSMNILANRGYTPEQVEETWQSFTNEYFLRFTPDEIARHISLVLQADKASMPVIKCALNAEKGTIEIFIYMENIDGQFAKTTKSFEQLGLNIVDAFIMATDNDQNALNIFQALTDHTDLESAAYKLEETRLGLIDKIANYNYNDNTTAPYQSSHRVIKHFDVPAEISFSQEQAKNRTIIAITSADKPGLLARISKVFLDSEIRVHNAKIATTGERADDLFYVTDFKNRPITDETAQQKIKQKLISSLDGS